MAEHEFPFVIIVIFNCSKTRCCNIGLFRFFCIIILLHLCRMVFLHASWAGSCKLAEVVIITTLLELSSRCSAMMYIWCQIFGIKAFCISYSSVLRHGIATRQSWVKFSANCASRERPSHSQVQALLIGGGVVNNPGSIQCERKGFIF